MSVEAAATEQVRTYSGWREHKPFGLLGMDTKATVIAMGLFAATILATTFSIWMFLLGMAATAGWVAANAWRIRGEAVADVVARKIAWQMATRKGWTDYDSTALARDAAWQLPGPLAATTLYRTIDSAGRPWAAVWNRRTGRLSATIQVAPLSTWLVEGTEADGWVSSWHGFLAQLGHQPTVTHVAITVETQPSPASALEASVLPRLKPDAPQAAKELIEQLVATSPQAAARVATRVTVTIDPARAPGAVPESLDEQLADFSRMLENLESKLGSCGVTVLGRATDQDIATWTRSAFDPAANDELARGRTHLGWADARPQRAVESWDRYRHDSGWSASWAWDEAPRQQVMHDVLTRLIGPTGFRKRIVLLYRPKTAAMAAQIVDDQVQASEFKATMRRKSGRGARARDDLDHSNALRAAAEEARGAGIGELSLYATVTTSTEAALESAAAEVEHRAEESKLHLRRAYGSQASYFVAGLSCGIDPAAVRRRA